MPFKSAMYCIHSYHTQSFLCDEKYREIQCKCYDMNIRFQHHIVFTTTERG